MSRRGVALLTVLWLVAALSTAAGATLALARVGADTTRNRVLLARSEWAREACSEILLARYAEHGKVAYLDTTDLGRGTWCRALIEEAGSRLDINEVTPEMVRVILRDDSLSDALLDWRDADDDPRLRGAEADWYRRQGRRAPRNGLLASIAELGFVRGFDSARVVALDRLLTARGTGRVDINRAPAQVLAALPGMSEGAVATILVRRGRRIGSSDELLALLPSSGRGQLLGRYQEFTAVAAFAPSRFVMRMEGGVRGSPIVSRGWITLVPASGRLAVIRREVE